MKSCREVVEKFIHKVFISLTGIQYYILNHYAGIVHENFLTLKIAKAIFTAHAC